MEYIDSYTLNLNPSTFLISNDLKSNKCKKNFFLQCKKKKSKKILHFVHKFYYNLEVNDQVDYLFLNS